MLELRSHCEHCQLPLPPESTDARICSFECTFCVSCVDGLLSNVCPNCAGGFSARPVRPARNWKGDNFLGAHPAATVPRQRPVDAAAHRQLVAQLLSIAPEAR